MTAIDICNAALAHNGMPRITNFDESSNSAKFCKDFFPICRDRVLRDHFWSFATRGTDLGRLAETPFDENYSFSYGLPNDLLRIVSLDPDEPFRRVGKKIFCNVPKAKIIYITRDVESSDFDSIFCEALEFAVAKELCLANSKDHNAFALFDQSYQRTLSLARSVDSVENGDAYPVRQKRTSDWLKWR